MVTSVVTANVRGRLSPGTRAPPRSPPGACVPTARAASATHRGRRAGLPSTSAVEHHDGVEAQHERIVRRGPARSAASAFSAASDSASAGGSAASGVSRSSGVSTARRREGQPEPREQPPAARRLRCEHETRRAGRVARVGARRRMHAVSSPVMAPMISHALSYTRVSADALDGARARRGRVRGRRPRWSCPRRHRWSSSSFGCSSSANKAVMMYPPSSEIPGNAAAACVEVLQRASCARCPRCGSRSPRTGSSTRRSPIFPGNKGFADFSHELYLRKLAEVRFHAGIEGTRPHRRSSRS